MGQLTLTICDHDHDGERIEAQSHQVAIDGTTIDVDLCSEHEKPVIELLESLRLIGRTQGGRGVRKAPAAAVAEFDCPFCERTFPTAQGVAHHRTRSHPDSLNARPRNFACTYCDKAFATRTHLRQHLRGPHKLDEETVNAELAKQPQP